MKFFRTLFFLIVVIIISMPGNLSFAAVDSGKIDFFKVFSNSDENINRIGNSIHNWSIYFPNDAVVNKNSKGTTFDMTSSSYKTEVSVNVFKNIHNYSLEELFASTVFSKSTSYSQYDTTYICSSSVKTDKNNNRYISISSITSGSFMYTASDSLDDQGTYNEERIYLGKSGKSDYIYDVNLSMNFPFYKQHQTLFSKIADSFETKFDTSNPNIKDLSEQVNTYRSFENNVYGWKIELAPYWKLQGAETSMSQTFKPLYTDDEINGKSNSSISPEDKTDSADTAEIADNSGSQSDKIKDSLNITVLSSIPAAQDFEQWSDNEIKYILTGCNEKLFTQVSKPQTISASGLKEKQLIYEVKDSSTSSLISAVTFVEGNGYRYKLTLFMSKSKYDEKSGKETFERMLKSFTLINSKSEYVKELSPIESVFNYSAPRTIAMKKFNLKVLTDNTWLENSSIYDGSLDDSYMYYDIGNTYSDSSTSETITVNHFRSGTILTLSGESSTDSIDKTLKTFFNDELSKQDIDSGILSIKMYKSTFNNIPVYKIVENYSLERMNQLSKANGQKSFDFTNLYDSYTYIFKQDDNLYTISFSIPFMNASEKNLMAIQSIWGKAIANQVDIGAKASQWQAVDLTKYKNAAQ